MTTQALEITGEMLIKEETCLSHQHSGTRHDWRSRGTVYSKKWVRLMGTGLKIIIAYILL